MKSEARCFFQSQVRTILTIAPPVRHFARLVSARFECVTDFRVQVRVGLVCACLLPFQLCFVWCHLTCVAGTSSECQVHQQDQHHRGNLCCRVLAGRVHSGRSLTFMAPQ